MNKDETIEIDQRKRISTAGMREVSITTAYDALCSSFNAMRGVVLDLEWAVAQLRGLLTTALARNHQLSVDKRQLATENEQLAVVNRQLTADARQAAAKNARLEHELAKLSERMEQLERIGLDKSNASEEVK